MRLAIDASRAAEEQKTGVGWYCFHLLRHLRSIIPDTVGVDCYTQKSLPIELGPFTKQWSERLLAWSPTPSRRWIRDDARIIGLPLWSQARLAWQVIRDRPDALFVPAHVIPDAVARWPRRIKTVTTIHDVVFRTHPDAYSARERWYADRATRLAVRYGDHVIVPTHHVARELEEFYGADAKSVTVIPHGVRLPPVRSASGGIQHSAFSIQQFPYILYVGRLETKKNVVRMVEAFDRIAEHHRDVHFVLAGSNGFGHEAVSRTIAQSTYRDRIHPVGWVDSETYRDLLDQAAVFCFPTLGEGFGLPIIEAMQAGVPVLTSQGGVHEEVSGGAALLVDPLSSEDIARGLEDVLVHQQLRQELVARGSLHASQFTWIRSAQKTWEVLHDVLSV